MSSKLRIPWGLFAALGVYVVCAGGFIWAQHLRSPEYRAARHLRAAHQALGPGDGKNAGAEQLITAYRELLGVAVLFPDWARIHDELERVHYLLDKRGGRLPEGLKRQGEALGARYRRIEEDRRPVLVVGARDLWDVDAVLEGPMRLAGWAALGAGLLVAGWLYGAMRGRW